MAVLKSDIKVAFTGKHAVSVIALCDDTHCWLAFVFVAPQTDFRKQVTVELRNTYSELV